MALPKQVAKKLKEVEDLEKQLQGETEVVEAAPEVPEVPEAVVETIEEPEAEPVLEEAIPEAVVDEPKEEPKKPEDDAGVWKQKYKTLQGMYDKEVPQLHTQVREMNQQLKELQDSFKAKAEEPKPVEKLVTDDDVKNFGEDLIEVQRKVAREVAAEFQVKLDTMQKENVELRELLGTTDSRVAESSFQSKLHQLVPDFAALNADKGWVSWLDEVDPVLRAPRRSVAQQAFAAGDAEAVAYYVDLYRKENVAVEPTPEAKPSEELERQIQPSRTAATATKTSQKGKIYTNSDIAKMFQKAATLNSSAKFDEANKLEAEIDAAYMDGRVVA